MKNILAISILIFLYGCGYTAMYSKDNLKQIYLSELNVSGDKVINKFVQMKLGKYTLIENENNFKLKIKTNSERLIVAKDRAGKATNIGLIVNLKISYSKSITDDLINEKEINISQRQDIKNERNNYEQLIYEQDILRNLTNLILDEIILKLSRFE